MAVGQTVRLERRVDGDGRPTPERALTEPERERVLEVLHSERFVDISPEETYATLLDEGTYLCSTRTMYRILAARHGGVRERRVQLTHRAQRTRGAPRCAAATRWVRGLPARVKSAIPGKMS